MHYKGSIGAVWSVEHAGYDAAALRRTQPKWDTCTPGGSLGTASTRTIIRIWRHTFVDDTLYGNFYLIPYGAVDFAASAA